MNNETHIEANTSTEASTTTRKTRDIGPEILRIISMFLIVCVHFLNYGGVINHANSAGELFALRGLYSFFTVSVNVFVLISGYFLVKSNFKLKKVIALWLQVFFFTTTSYIICGLFIDHDFSIRYLFFKCFFPLLQQRYWFFTAYIVLYLIFPLLNKILNNCSRKECWYILIGVFVLSYLSNRFPIDNVINIRTGYNVLWFICLYFVGAILRLHPPKFKKWVVLLVYLACIFLVWANFYYKPTYWGYKYFVNTPDYTSPLVLLGSIALFLLFNNIRSDNKVLTRIINIISSTTFGIFLFDGCSLKNWFYFDLFKITKYHGHYLSVLYVLLFSLCMFVCGMIYDFIRQLIFKLSTKTYNKIKEKRQL